jgi:hypothetical protein
MRKTEENVRIQMKQQHQQIIANQEQINHDKKISEAGFWLTLRDLISQYDDMASFFDGGKWRSPGGPGNAEEWVRVKSYISLLQQLNIMID